MIVSSLSISSPDLSSLRIIKFFLSILLLEVLHQYSIVRVSFVFLLDHCKCSYILIFLEFTLIIQSIVLLIPEHGLLGCQEWAELILRSRIIMLIRFGLLYWLLFSLEHMVFILASTWIHQFESLCLLTVLSLLWHPSRKNVN